MGSKVGTEGQRFQDQHQAVEDLIQKSARASFEKERIMRKSRFTEAARGQEYEATLGAVPQLHKSSYATTMPMQYWQSTPGPD
jgi:hypothetical protein